ncbi:unnamed protein product [Phytophthora lilii]|uniref:Unnamed protein product n=1 Tax=Phytophthora lilii TaxID=2077276 RepID=A0A9W6TJF4_9STRA|nr:unnamed protein product [Phytophthora lilii]
MFAQKPFAIFSSTKRICWSFGRMAGGEEDPDAVLAFLLGAAPSLDAPAPADDMPEMEPATDSDVDASASATDWDALTSGESGDESASEPQATTEAAATAAKASQPETEVTDPSVEAVGEESCKEGIETKGNNNSEAEHEDDCTADSEAPQKQKREKKQKKLGGQRSGDVVTTTTTNVSSGAVVKATTTKARRGSGGSRTADINSPKKSLTVETKEKKDGRTDNMPTLEEFLFVACVATVLVAYLGACVYSFFHPLVVPLPDYKELYSAYDISNVSVHIVSPVDNALITPQGVTFEWKLANFPADALQQYGAEVFRYRVSLDDEVITSEVGFLALNDGGEDEATDSTADTVNRTVRFPIPLRKFTRDDDGPYKLHLEVTTPIPGLIGQLTTYEQIVYVRKPAAASPNDGVQLTITSPSEGAIFKLGQSIVLEYTAVNVEAMEVILDDSVYLRKAQVNDGNLLLRGLGVGRHTFEVRAVDDYSDVIKASSVLHVEIIESLDAKRA